MNSYNQFPNNDAENQPNNQPPTPPVPTNPVPYYSSPYGSGGWNQGQNYQQPVTNWQQNPAPFSNTPPTPPPKSKKNNVLATIAIVLASGVAGFGGGMIAGNINTNSPKPPFSVSEDATSTAGRPAQTESYSIREVAGRAGQSVVSITTENVVSDPFFGGRIASGAGSGVVVSEDGYVVTNNHVIEGAKNIAVTLPDGSEYKAKLIGTDPESDIAVVKIEADNLVPAAVGNSDVLEVGDFVLAIGNPMGTLGGTVTDGIISATNRSVTIGSSSMSLLQMSAAVSPGNSGGGLFDANGELIGIVNAKSGGEGAEGLGFAIPVNHAVDISKQLIEFGKVAPRPALGIMAGNVADLADETLDGQKGVYVEQVLPNTGAEQAGVQVGDIIIKAGDKVINVREDLAVALSGKKTGEKITLVVLRDGQEVKIEVTLLAKSETAA